MRRLRLVVAGWVVGLGLIGCSLARLGYEFSPTWFAWEIDSSLSLDRHQKAMVRQHLESVYQWHRRKELPRIAAWLEEIRREALSGSITAARLGQWRLRMVDEFWPPVAEQLAGPMADLILSLRADQLDYFRDDLAESNRKYRKQRKLDASHQALVQARIERYSERGEFLIGSLSSEQHQVLREGVEALAAEDEAWYAERLSRQQRLLALMQRAVTEKPPPEVVRQWCADYLKDPWRSPDESRRVLMESSVLAMEHLMARLFASTTNKQRRHLAERLSGFAEQFAEIARAP